MNSFERVWATVHHQTPDRVPCDFQAEGVIMDRLKKYFEVETAEEILEILDIDSRSVGPRYIGPPMITDENGLHETVIHGGPRTKRLYNAAGDYSDSIVWFPWADVEGPADLEGRTHWDGKPEWWDFSHVEEDIDRINEKAPRWIKTHGDPSGLQHLTMWVGDEKFMCDLLADEDLACAMIEQANKGRLEHALKTLEAGKGKIHELSGGGDYGAQNSLLISLPMFRKFFKELYVNFYKEVKKNFDVEISFHTCGSVVDLIPELIEVGVTILDPIQTSAKGMDINVLKQRFGKDLTFHGAIDVQQVLPRYTPEELKVFVENTIDVLGKDGGYILSPSHNLQMDTTIENILTMYETAQKRKIRR